MLRHALRVVTLGLCVALTADAAASQVKAAGGGVTSRPGQTPAKTHRAPEIDPGLAGGALVLLLGGTYLLTDRRRPRHAVS